MGQTVSSSKVELTQHIHYKINFQWKKRYAVLYENKTLEIFINQQQYLENTENNQSNIMIIDIPKLKHCKTDKIKNKYYSIQMITILNKTEIIAFEDESTFKIWYNRILNYFPGSIIHSGWLLVRKPKEINFWRKWFVLTNDQKLRYYENESCSKYKNYINLTKILYILYGDKNEISTYKMEIVLQNMSY